MQQLLVVSPPPKCELFPARTILRRLHQVSSLQLLHHQAPQAAGLILLASPVFDDTEAILGILKNTAGSLRRSGSPLSDVEEEMSEGFFWVGMVLLSCLLAFLVNLSTFLVIGRTSPVSYQVTVRTV